MEEYEYSTNWSLEKSPISLSMTSVARPSHETASDMYVYNTHRHQKKGDSCRWSPFLSLYVLGVCSHLLLKRENILRLTSLSLSRSHWLNQCSVHERFCERCIYAYREWARCIDCVKNNDNDDVYEWEKNWRSLYDMDWRAWRDCVKHECKICCSTSTMRKWDILLRWAIACRAPQCIRSKSIERAY